MKRWLKMCCIVVLAIVACLSIVACNNSKDENEEPKKSVQISQPTATIEVGNSLQLTAESSDPEDVIQWTSSADTVAQVTQNGLVSAIKKGTAEITASVEGASAKCVVTVTDSRIPVITVTSENVNINTEMTYQITPTVYFDSEPVEAVLTFESENAEIATVSDAGLVTGIKSGSTKITITADYEGSVATAEITVTVKEDISVELSVADNELDTGDKTLLTATVRRNGKIVDEPVVYRVADEKQAKIVEEGDDVYVMALLPGEIVVFADYESAPEFSGYATVTSSLTVAQTFDESQVVFDTETDGNADLVYADAANVESIMTSDGKTVSFTKGDGKLTIETAEIPRTGIQDLLLIDKDGVAKGYGVASVTMTLNSNADFAEAQKLAKAFYTDGNKYGGYFVLGADILGGGQLIPDVKTGNAEDGFLGVLDGQGHKVNMGWSKTLIGTIGKGGLVKNILCIDNYNVENAGQGLIANICYGTIENVLANGTATAGSSTATEPAAAIVGTLYGTLKNSAASLLTIKDKQNLFASAIGSLQTGAVVENVYSNNVSVAAGIGNLNGQAKPEGLKEFATTHAYIEAVLEAESLPQFIKDHFSSEKYFTDAEFSRTVSTNKATVEKGTFFGRDNVTKMVSTNDSWSDRFSLTYFSDITSYDNMVIDLYLDPTVGQLNIFMSDYTSYLRGQAIYDSGKKTNDSAMYRFYDASTGEMLTNGTTEDILPVGRWVTLVWNTGDAAVNLKNLTKAFIAISPDTKNVPMYIDFSTLRFTSDYEMLSLEDMSDTMKVGDSVDPAVKLLSQADSWLPDQEQALTADALEIQSSDTGVLAIEAGKIVAKAEGDSVVSFTYEKDGKTFSASITITVSAA